MKFHGVKFSIPAPFKENPMDPSLAKPFIKATKDVLSAMAALEVVAGTPYVKKTKWPGAMFPP